MDQRQNDELTMLEDVQTYFNVVANLAKITPIVDLLAGKTELDGYITTIKNNKAIQDADTKGIGVNKETLRSTVINETLVLAGALVNLGRKIHDNVLIEKFNFTKSGLEKLRDNDLLTAANNTITAANANLPALASGGVTALMVTALTTDTASFSLILTGPEGAKQAKKLAGQAIHDTFVLSRQAMDLTVRPLMRTNFAKTDNTFYSGFINATQIINTGIHHLDFFGAVIDSVTGDGLHGALVRVLQGTTEIANTKTGDKGHFQFKEIPEGTYSVEISRPGYQTQTVPNIAIVTAESTKKTFSMVAV